MNQSQQFSCFCSQQVPVHISDLKVHIKACPTYQRESPFYREFAKLPLDNLQVVHLTAMKAEFSIYLDVLDQQLLKQSNKAAAQRLTGDLNKMVVEPKQSEFRGIPGNILKCVRCSIQLDSNMDIQKIFYVDQCLHLNCRVCINKEILEEFVNKDGIIKCVCGAQLVHKEIELLVGSIKQEQLNQKLIEKQFNIVTCTKCSGKFEFEVGKVSGINLKDPQSQKPLSKELVDHYVNNRFTCLDERCKQEQCKSCKTSPYHLGMTCKQLEFKKTQKRCRYCDNPLQDQNAQKKQLVCKDAECQEKAKWACNKTLACGHECYGFVAESKCLPCLHKDCRSAQSEQKGDDYCNICFVDALNQAPCILSQCNHIFHYQCIMKRVELKWHGPRINFNFCLCPLCKTWMQFIAGAKVQQLLELFHALLEDVKKKAVERLKYEGKEKDEKLLDPKSNYHQKPLEYSLAIYCYYECCKCKKPYFGGAKDCQRAMEDDNKPFNPLELVCGNCSQVDAVDQCKIHGNEHIEFKCKFCCNMSVWFCWGSTHFCDDCHKKQCNNDYVSKYPIEKLPKCPGREKCPLGVLHKPNGFECAMGCTLCINSRANVQQF